MNVSVETSVLILVNIVKYSTKLSYPKACSFLDRITGRETSISLYVYSGTCKYKLRNFPSEFTPPMFPYPNCFRPPTVSVPPNVFRTSKWNPCAWS